MALGTQFQGSPHEQPVDTVPQSLAVFKRRLLQAFARREKAWAPPWNFHQLAKLTGIPHGQYSLVLRGRKEWARARIAMQGVIDGKSAMEIRRALPAARSRRQAVHDA